MKKVTIEFTSESWTIGISFYNGNYVFSVSVLCFIICYWKKRKW